MTIAKARSIIETTIATSLAPLTVVFDNTDESPPPLPYALATVTFNTTNDDNLGGCICPYVTGTTQVVIYVPRQEGSGRAETLAIKVLLAWEELAATKLSLPAHPPVYPAAGVMYPSPPTGLFYPDPTMLSPRVVPRSMEGPKTLSPDQRNAHVVVVAAAFSAELS